MVLALAILSAVAARAQTATAPDDQTSDYLAEAARQFAINPHCLPQNDEEIVVCGRRDRDERYRLPIRPDGFDPAGPVESVSRERNALLQEGESGLGTCSNVGPGGMFGCFFRDMKRRREQHGE